MDCLWRHLPYLHHFLFYFFTDRKQTVRVERVDTYKYLGVVFDSKLNWNQNINYVLKKSELENVLHEKAEIIWSKFRYASNFL